MYSSHYHLYPLPAIDVGDIIGSERKFGKDGDAYQIHVLIDVIGSKGFLDKRYRVAGRGKRRQQRQIYPLEPEGAG